MYVFTLALSKFLPVKFVPRWTQSNPAQQDAWLKWHCSASSSRTPVQWCHGTAANRRLVWEEGQVVQLVGSQDNFLVTESDGLVMLTSLQQWEDPGNLLHSDPGFIIHFCNLSIISIGKVLFYYHQVWVEIVSEYVEYSHQSLFTAVTQNKTTDWLLPLFYHCYTL